jgi:hypothetical protein
VSWRREPLVWFLLLSAGVFAVSPLLGARGRPGADTTILVPRDGIETLKRGFHRAWQRDPTEEELRDLIEDKIRTEILAREAVAMGLDRDDSVIRQHLRMKLEQIAGDAVRRAPTEADLAAHFASHAETYREEPRFTFRQVYLSPDRRGDSLRSDAEGLLVRLNALPAGANVSALGDRLMLDSEFDEIPGRDVARLFGDSFADNLDELEPGRWAGPIPSGYGAHLVFLESRREGRLPALDEVRREVERDWSSEKARTEREALYRKLRERYRVRIELPAEPAAAGSPYGDGRRAGG